MNKFLVHTMAVSILGAAAAGQVTQRVSLASNGTQGDDLALESVISADGRWVAFTSDANNFAPATSSGVYVRDRQTGTLELISIAADGTHGGDFSRHPSISADGRYVAFSSEAADLVAGDVNNRQDVFVRDRQLGTTELVSLATNGAPGDSISYLPSISADGRYVAFTSAAANLVPNDVNLRTDVFVRDRDTDSTSAISVGTDGGMGWDDSALASISADGRCVSFSSRSPNLVAGDLNGLHDIFVRDRVDATTERVSVDSSGAQADDLSTTSYISADGRFVAFASNATNLVAGDTNGETDVFVRDRRFDTTERVSVDSDEAQADDYSLVNSISADGRYVAFITNAHLVPGDVQLTLDVFLRDRQNDTTEKASVDSAGATANNDCEHASLSADGRYVAFTSFASNLVPGDSNGHRDVFVRDRLGGTSFTSLCHPGVAGVIACPCANPPSAAGRGCDNSSATGGAVLSAYGGTYLSSDSLVFTTSGEKPTALSIVSQWTAPSASGIVLGMGVRCASGSLKRLYTKSAVGGSVTAPDFGDGDPTVSVRSAALGNSIAAGQSRWYYVYYRDPIVLGGCPAISTFNATQTGVVSWSP